jgi:hypothetical protein
MATDTVYLRLSQLDYPLQVGLSKQVRFLGSVKSN